MSGAEPGWFPDPSRPGQSRWWDGTAWTDRTLPATQVTTAPPPPPATPKRAVRLPLWAWAITALAAIALLVFLAPLVGVAALTVLITGVVALVKNTPTWLRFPSRRIAMTATVVAAVVLFVSASISSVTNPDSQDNAELAATTSDSSSQSSTPRPARTPSATPAPTPTTREEVVTESIAFTALTAEDAALPSGQTVITAEGRDGERTLTYRVSELDGAEVSRELVSDVVTVEPVAQVTTFGTYVAPPPPPPAPAAPGCDSNYADACVPVASDVDCGSGSGNGPAYFHEVARVVGADVYDLDRDGDGYACEP